MISMRVILERNMTKTRRWRMVLTSFSVAAGISVLLLGGMVVAVLLAGDFGNLGFYAVGGAVVLSFLAIILILRQDELAVTITIAIQLYVDWYIGLHIISQVIALVLLGIFALARSPQHPWAEPRALWLWGVFLVLTILPAIRGAVTPFDAAYYYPNVIFGALSFFWLGAIIAQNSTHMQRLFKMLAGFGTLIAAHTIIQATTGKFLFGTPHYDPFLQSVSYFPLYGGGIATHRVGSFFVDPNWDGTFFAMMLFIPLGLFIESSSFLERALYLVELSLMLLALLFTYSLGASVGTLAGIIVFFLFVGRARYRVLLLFLILTGALGVVAFFPNQIALLLQHAANPLEAEVRVAAWQEGLSMISAYPLTGIGLSLTLYNSLSPRYGPLGLGHPHNSYLELGAMAGLPVLVVFIALLSFALWQAYCNWALADVRARSLIGAGIAAAIAVSVNSVSINAWTLPPLAAIGWLILGTIASPLLSRGLGHQIIKK